MRRMITGFLALASVVAYCGVVRAQAVNPTAAPAEEDAVRVFRDVQPSVVGLENAECSGTGIILDSKGLILTNAHVVVSPFLSNARWMLSRGGPGNR
jgi:S1-C subfamily serine protease